MIFDAKARRCHFLDTIGAFFKLEYLTANAAQKVMMMALVRTFVTRRLAGNFHRDDASLVHQRFKGSVNGCQSDPGTSFKARAWISGWSQRIMVAS